MAALAAYDAFDPQAYLDTFFKGLSPDWVFTNWSKLWLNNIHAFYKKAGLERNQARILEFGGGPHMIPLFSAAPFAKELIFADYTPANREIVGKWQNGEPGAKDYSQYVQYFVEELEGGSKDDVPARIADVKAKLSIIPCDIFNEEDILLGSVDGKFDVISTHLCMECATQTIEDFSAGIKKLKNLLAPGGQLLFVSDFGDTFYAVGQTKFPILQLTPEQIEECVLDAKFKHYEKIIFTHDDACPSISKEEQASIDEISDCGGEICFFCYT